MGGVGIRRPRRVIGAWLVLLALLGIFGFGVEDRLIRSDLHVPGTRSAEARDLAREHFGESNARIVLLEGPPRALERQGRALAASLQRDRTISVVGPWARGAAPELRPARERALVLVRVDRPFHEVSEEEIGRASCRERV